MLLQSFKEITFILKNKIIHSLDWGVKTER